MFLIQLLIILICIYIGSRLSSIGLGVMGMVGLLILIFIFGMKPADPPLEVMLIIMSVVTAAAALQAAGGMDYLVQIAAKILRRNPNHITILGPLVTYLFTLFAGTAHISYCIFPIIAEVATKARIRPERALSMSVTAAHMGITASPVSAASAALLTVLAISGVQLVDILIVCIASTLIGVLVGIAFVYKRGKELNEDVDFLKKMEDKSFAESINQNDQASSVELKPGAISSVVVFGIAVLTIVMLGAFPTLLPNYSTVENFAPSFSVGAQGQLQIPSVIMMVMLAATGIIILLCKTSAASVAKASLFSSAGTAAISIFGVIWMTSTFMDHNYIVIKESLGGLVTAYPWSFAIALFVLSILLFSQASTTKALMPLGLALGLSPAYLIGLFPAVNGHFFIPGYPTLLTAIQFDRTGTTKIGKYVLNHSFMLPGLVTTLAAVIAGIILQSVIL